MSSFPEEEYCEFGDLPKDWCAHCLGHIADWEPAISREDKD